jgi:hypothetical protein
MSSRHSKKLPLKRRWLTRQNISKMVTEKFSTLARISVCYYSNAIFVLYLNTLDAANLYNKGIQTQMVTKRDPDKGPSAATLKIQ